MPKQQQQQSNYNYSKQNLLQWAAQVSDLPKKNGSAKLTTGVGTVGALMRN